MITCTHLRADSQTRGVRSEDHSPSPLPSINILPKELIDGILQELSRFDHLKFLTLVSKKYRLYLQDRIRKELWLEIGPIEENSDEEIKHLRRC